MKRLSKELAPYNIGSGGQHSFLLTILSRPGITQEQLTQMLKFDKATTARSIKQLEQAGYLTREPDPNDGRSQLLFPTEKAKAFDPTLLKIMNQSNEVLSCRLTDEEESQLISLLQKVSLGPPEEEA
ncbi:MarR family winged helix-turn-helix transcriptional regulator [Paenibacillus sp. NPDC058071]|uniref:MarR family winged helix-turn-helix transcriptional regulator n=1 Tax=Paenibacillus sp. NPDC058071 TaxID=3346326 RepID=UPI0036D7BC03